jgi:crotonobetainyl-CoA:carnitine CoA-transferase CaiB-like acyl-CoA transferase
VALYFGAAVEPRARDRAPNPLYNAYRTGDGKWIFLLGLQPDRHWDPVVAALGRPEWLQDPRFVGSQERAANAVELVALLDEVFGSRPLAEWVPVLDGHGVWWTRIQAPLDLLEDAQAQAAGGFVDVPGVEGTTRAVASPIDFLGTPWAPRRRAPEVGEHTEEILLNLGYDWDDISRLREDGALG